MDEVNQSESSFNFHSDSIYIHDDNNNDDDGDDDYGDDDILQQWTLFLKRKT